MANNGGKEKLIRAGLALARKQGYRLVSRDEIALTAKVAHGLITFHFRDMDGMRAAIVERAIKNECWPVMAEALVARHPGMRKLDREVHDRLIGYIASLT